MINQVLLSGLFVLFSAHQASARDGMSTVNAVLGDLSFVQRFGAVPDRRASDDLRISTHLEHVERMLRNKDVSSMPASLREQRSKILDLLERYTDEGQFPKNFDHPGTRMSCFIDKDRRICAVGYLIERTAGRALAEEINVHHQYDLIHDMNMPALLAWIDRSGLTLDECALIQPTYSDPKPDNYIEPKYGFASALLSGVDLSIMILNGSQMSSPQGSKVVPILGLVTGTGQFLIGLAHYPSEEQTLNGTASNESEKAVSLVNIALGTGTVILSTTNLLTWRSRSRDKQQAWNFHLSPMADGRLGSSLTAVRSF